MTGKDEVLCVANLSRFAQAVELDLRRFAGLVPVEILGYTPFPRIGEVPYLLTLAPYGSYWFDLQTTPEVEAHPPRVHDTDALQLPPDGVWTRFLDGLNRVLLERSALPSFLARQRWFGAKTQPIARVTLFDRGLVVTDRLILKLFRRIQAGPHPDIEVSRFLAEDARYARTPALAGSLEYVPAKGESAGLGVLQALVVNQGDGWRCTVDALESFFERVVPLGLPPTAPDGSVVANSERQPSPEVTDAMGQALGHAATLGRRTAELHLALGGSPDDPAFAPEPLTEEDRVSLAGTLRDHASGVLAELRRRMTSLPPELTDDVWGLVNARVALLDRFDRLASTPVEAIKTRIHGDYHLGQVLVAENDYIVIDFEGEPARTLPSDARSIRHSRTWRECFVRIATRPTPDCLPTPSSDRTTPVWPARGPICGSDGCRRRSYAPIARRSVKHGCSPPPPSTSPSCSSRICSTRRSTSCDTS